MTRVHANLSVRFPWWVLVTLGLLVCAARAATWLRLWRPTEQEADAIMTRIGTWAADQAVYRLK